MFHGSRHAVNGSLVREMIQEVCRIGSVIVWEFLFCHDRLQALISASFLNIPLVYLVRYGNVNMFPVDKVWYKVYYRFNN